MAYKCCRGGCMRLCFDANHRGVIAYLRRCCSIYNMWRLKKCSNRVSGILGLGLREK